jgi:outer membrane protein
MRKLSRSLLLLGIALFCTQAHAQQQTYAAPNAAQSFRVGIVNTKKCLEKSKLGQQEQVSFEKMKKQMETILHDKERALEDVESKLNDDDYMDSISDEAAAELKRKRKTIRQEGYQLQNQYMQTLQQANLKIVQKITESISKASEQVAKESAFSSQPLDAIFSDEASTYYNPQLDVSEKIIAKMNAMFDAEQKDNPTKN